MRSALFVCVTAVGLAACAADPVTDSTGWSYIGTPIKGQASLERQFRDDDGKCRGTDMSIYRPCMFSRGYAEGVLPAAAPVVAAPPPIVSNAPPDWRVRATEARTLAAQMT